MENNVGGIVLEDLKFQQSHDTDTYSNRNFHQFTYKKMLNSLIRMGLRNGFSVKIVNPAYTSVIGKLKYSKNFGISVHEAAAFAIKTWIGIARTSTKRDYIIIKTKLQQNCVFLLLPWKKVKRIRKSI